MRCLPVQWAACSARKLLPADDGIGAPHHVGEAAQPSAIVQSLRRIGIAKIHGIIEIEQQSPRCPPQQTKLPPGQQAALHNHIRSVQSLKQASRDNQ